MHMHVYKTYISRLIIGLLFLVPFIPLYISSVLFFPYITGKAFVFRTLVEIAFGLWVFLAIFYEEYRPRRGSVLSAVLLFAGVTIVATIFGANPLRSFWSNFERMEGLVAYLHLYAYFLVLAHVFRKEEWFWYFHVFIAAGIIENFYGLFQRLGYLASPQGGFRVDGTIGNPTYLAAYLIFILFFSLALLVRVRSTALKILYGVISFFTLSIIYFTATRGAVLGLLAAVLAGGVAYVIFFRPQTPRESRYRMMAIGGIIALCLGSFVLWLNRDTTLIKSYPALSRLTNLSFSDRTIASRFSIWSMSLEAVKEHPMLGWGPENYNIVFSKYYRPELWPQEPWFDRSHNIVLDWLINAGALGLIGYLSMFGAAFFAIFKLYRKNQWTLPLALLTVGTLVAYFLQNLFVFDNIATYICFFAVLAYIHSEATSDGGVSSKSRVSPGAVEYQSFALAGILVVTFFVMYIIVMRPLMTNRHLLQGLAMGGRDPQAAYNEFQAALGYGYLGKTEVREQFAQFVFGGGLGSNASPQLVNDVLKAALTEANENVKVNSQDARSYVFLGALYTRINTNDAEAQTRFLNDSVKALKQAIEISPKKQQIYFELADTYVRLGDMKSAIEVATTAYNFDRRFPAAQMNLAFLYILSGQQGAADAIFQEQRGTIDPPDPSLAENYSRIISDAYTKRDFARVGYYAKRLANVSEGLVHDNPDNVDYRKRLAFAYYLTGDMAKYRAALTEIVLRHPESKADIDAFTKQVEGTVVTR